MAKVVVVIPTYNEKDNIRDIVKSVFDSVPHVNLLVVDDNSPDGTRFIVEDLMKQYKNLSIKNRQKKEGLGKAYTSTFMELLNDKDISTIISMDADLSHDPKSIVDMLEKRKNYDVVIGSRYISGGKTQGWELWRKVLSIGGNTYTKIITGMPINDFTSGFMCMSVDSLRKIDLNKISSSGYAFLIELKYELYVMRNKISEVPIIFKNRVGGESKISNHIIKEGIKAPWRLALRIKR